MAATRRSDREINFHETHPAGILYCAVPQKMGKIFRGNGKDTGGGRLPQNPQAWTGTEIQNST